MVSAVSACNDDLREEFQQGFSRWQRTWFQQGHGPWTTALFGFKERSNLQTTKHLKKNFQDKTVKRAQKPFKTPCKINETLLSRLLKGGTFRTNIRVLDPIQEGLCLETTRSPMFCLEQGTHYSSQSVETCTVRGRSIGFTGWANGKSAIAVNFTSIFILPIRAVDYLPEMIPVPMLLCRYVQMFTSSSSEFQQGIKIPAKMLHGKPSQQEGGTKQYWRVRTWFHTDLQTHVSNRVIHPLCLLDNSSCNGDGIWTWFRILTYKILPWPQFICQAPQNSPKAKFRFQAWWHWCRGQNSRCPKVYWNISKPFINVYIVHAFVLHIKSSKVCKDWNAKLFASEPDFFFPTLLRPHPRTAPASWHAQVTKTLCLPLCKVRAKSWETAKSHQAIAKQPPKAIAIRATKHQMLQWLAGRVPLAAMLIAANWATMHPRTCPSKSACKRIMWNVWRLKGGKRMNDNLNNDNLNAYKCPTVLRLSHRRLAALCPPLTAAGGPRAMPHGLPGCSAHKLRLTKPDAAVAAWPLRQQPLYLRSSNPRSTQSHRCIGPLTSQLKEWLSQTKP